MDRRCRLGLHCGALDLIWDQEGNGGRLGLVVVSERISFLFLKHGFKVIRFDMLHIHSNLFFTHCLCSFHVVVSTLYQILHNSWMCEIQEYQSGIPRVVVYPSES